MTSSMIQLGITKKKTNKNMVKIAILGADRVGKSSFIKFHGLEAYHFEAPKPTDLYWFSQYEQAKNFDYTDRGPLEAGFYRPIPDVYIKDYIESSPIWNKTHFIIIHKNWGVELEARHIEELAQQEPNARRWWTDSMIAKRKSEHFAYYKYITRLADYCDVSYEILDS